MPARRRGGVPGGPAGPRARIAVEDTSIITTGNRNTAENEKALVVGIATKRSERPRVEASLDEMAQLAEAAGAEVVGTVLQERERRDPATLVGKGKVGEIGEMAEDRGAELVLFDEELSPAQHRNVEEGIERKVLDRTQLILDIFARRARTKEGRLQVELAQLEYLLPRLAGKGILLSRLGGGIGTRGPGETKLETDRRRIRSRISAIKRDIDKVRQTRATRRLGRERTDTPVVALVGYTNAGKSTLFTALTRAETEASSQLFMTLDPLVRKAKLRAGADVLVIDTVGFIQKLPHKLVAAFRATLEEVLHADLLLHVMDASAEDLEERAAAVEEVLREIGATERPRLVVLNKSDRVDAQRGLGLKAARPDAVLVSALRGEGLETLREVIARRVGLEAKTVSLRFDASDAKGISAAYGAGRVVSHEATEDTVQLEVEMPERAVERFREHIA